jgi:hypothetical protein
MSVLQMPLGQISLNNYNSGGRCINEHHSPDVQQNSTDISCSAADFSGTLASTKAYNFEGVRALWTMVMQVR